MAWFCAIKEAHLRFQQPWPLFVQSIQWGSGCVDTGKGGTMLAGTNGGGNYTSANGLHSSEWNLVNYYNLSREDQKNEDLTSGDLF